MASSKRRKRGRRGGASQGRRKRGGGALMGMRSGFKKAARSVGVGEQSKGPQKRSWLSTAFTIVLALAAVGVIYYRFFR